MAKDKDDKAAATDGDEQLKKKGGIAGLLTKLPVLIGGVMIVEAAVLLVGVKMLGGGPAPADAHDVAEVQLDDHGNPIPAGPAHDEIVEVPVDALRAPNVLNGRTYLYDVEISVRVKAADKEHVEARLKASTATVRDRLRQIIAGIDPKKLNGASEPGLETLRRQVKYRLDEIVGGHQIVEVLVPRCIPYRTDY